MGCRGAADAVRGSGRCPREAVIADGDTGPGVAVAYITLRLLRDEDLSLCLGGWDEWNRKPNVPSPR